MLRIWNLNYWGTGKEEILLPTGFKEYVYLLISFTIFMVNTGSVPLFLFSFFDVFNRQ